MGNIIKLDCGLAHVNVPNVAPAVAVYGTVIGCWNGAVPITHAVIGTTVLTFVDGWEVPGGFSELTYSVNGAVAAAGLVTFGSVLSAATGVQTLTTTSIQEGAAGAVSALADINYRVSLSWYKN